MNNWPIIKEIILCPDCRSDKLKFSKKNILCKACKKTYPIIDDLPVLIKKSDQKRIIESWNEEDKELQDYRLKTTPLVAEFVRKLSRNSSLSLDCGSGLGAYTNYFSGIVVSIDLFPFFVNKTRENSKNRNNVFIVADAKNLPFKLNCFSFCFCSSVLEHFPKIESDKIIQDLIDLSKDNIMVDVPNSGNLLINSARGLYERIITGAPEKMQNKELEHHRLFSVNDLKKSGFKVYGCLSWYSHDRIKSKIITSLTDSIMRIFPSIAGTIIGVLKKSKS